MKRRWTSTSTRTAATSSWAVLDQVVSAATFVACHNLSVLAFRIAFAAKGLATGTLAVQFPIVAEEGLHVFPREEDMATGPRS